MAWPRVWLLGRPVRLFDIVGVAATAGLAVTLLKSVADTTRELYRLERVSSPPTRLLPGVW